MKTHHSFYILLLALIMTACSEEGPNDFPRAASLTVVHAAAGVPAVHVEYFGDELEALDFSINPTLAFGDNDRFTLPANESRTLNFIPASDTTSVVFKEEISLQDDAIATYFLLGNSDNLSSRTIETRGLQRLTDSVNAIRFINMAEGVTSLNIGIRDSTVTLGSDLSFAAPTEFIEVDARLENENYIFTFKDAQDTELATFNFQQYRIFDFPGFFSVQTLALRRNVTLALVGRLDDNTLEVVQINHF